MVQLSKRTEVCRDYIHEVRALHRSRWPREIPRRAGAVNCRHAANDALGDIPLGWLSVAPKSRRLSQPVPLHAAAAVGYCPRRRNGDRAAGTALCGSSSRATIATRPTYFPQASRSIPRSTGIGALSAARTRSSRCSCETDRNCFSLRCLGSLAVLRMRVQGESVLVKRPVGSIILARGHLGHGLRRRIPIMAKKSV